MDHKTRTMRRIEQEYEGKNIAQILTELYKELGTQAAVAERLGVDAGTINSWQWRLGIRFDSQPIVSTEEKGGPQ